MILVILSDKLVDKLSETGSNNYGKQVKTCQMRSNFVLTTLKLDL